MSRSYLDSILTISKPYIEKALSVSEHRELMERTEKLRLLPRKEIVKGFCQVYRDIIKQRHQSETPPPHNSNGLNKKIDKNDGRVKLVWGNCLNVMRSLKTESIHLMVTSPPYYNARSYSNWDTLDDYLSDMSQIIKESYRILDNHRAFVFNVGDITGNDNRNTKSSWGSRRIPLGAYFTVIFEEAGFKFIDDIIWDKGEVESQRHKNGDTPSPLYQYPMNCYEHIMVFYKHRADEMRYPCPVCGCLKVNGNAYSGVGIRSWECKNTKCFERSAANRGKRFSMRSMVMSELSDNVISKDFIKKWRRDIVRINPTIKINCKGENTLGHTAPYPEEIPEYAIKTMSGKGELILDPFAGSFTTAISAAKLGRIGIGVELNKGIFRKGIFSNIKKHNLQATEITCPTKTKSA